MYKILSNPLPLALPFAALLLAGACDAGTGASADPDAGPACSDLYFADSDEDGYGDDDTSLQACDQPEGYVALAGDCNDGNAAINPTSDEICDGEDNDCNGLTDSADPAIDLATQRAYFRDNDNDGFGDAGQTMTSCDKPSGYVTDATDCNDNNSTVNPAANEVCDDIDNDCDTLRDEDDDSLDQSTATAYYFDSDGDGFGVGDAVLACSSPVDHALQAGDCNDDASTAHPGATELCDALDNDCDGGVDGTVAAPNQCGGYAGNYAGSYSIAALEKLGSTVINNMTCNGTSAITIDLSATPAVQGTVSCTRVGGLTLFDSNQSGTLTGTVDLDGNISGLLVHEYNSSLTRSYSFSGTLAGDDLSVAGSGSLLPHPMSAVPWQVDFSID